jgi:hypothetical protein
VRYDLRAKAQGPDIEDVDAVPYLSASGREGYRRFLWLAPPRAFALSPDGYYAYRRGDDAPQRALAECVRLGGKQCALYAVGQDLVGH